MSQWDFDYNLAVRVHCYIILVTFPAIIVLGSSLNITCIVVLLRKQVFPASASAFMLWITFNDVLALLIKGTTHYLEELSNYNISWWPYQTGALKHSSPVACCAYSAVTYYFLCGCPFYLAGLTLQRALYTLCPARRPSLRASVATLAGFTAVALTFPVFRVVLAEYRADSNAPCRLASIKNPVTLAFYYYQTVLSNMCIFAFLLLGTVCITCVLYCRGGQPSRTRTTQRVSHTLLLMNCSFLVTYLPVGIFQFCVVSFGKEPNEYRLLFGFLNSIMYLNFALNGLSYLASQRFRVCALQFFRSDCSCQLVATALRKRTPVVHTDVSARCSTRCQQDHSSK